jgi:5-(carboxyamino)imidazole ribonucleotide synthase
MKIGILGGGQLGRMLLQQAANYQVETWVLENDNNCPAAHLCHHFVLGSITNYEQVLAFGRQVDKLTIEIENVNVDALEQLEKEGKQVYPSAAVLRTIKNKITQKEFYKLHQIPSPSFVVTQNLTELQQHKSLLPAVHKIAEGGYDGRGVQIINTTADFANGFNAPSVLETKLQIAKEIAIIIGINDKGKYALYPAVDMVVDPHKNQLDYQLCPAQLPDKILWKIEAIAIKLVQAFNSPGIYAVEMIIDTNSDVWVNETAPRVHNSGHHTIEAHYCSQFDMLWRIMLNYPLGNTAAIMPSSLVNITGAQGHSGPAHYEGLNEVLKMENTFVHLYGKNDTKPGRKMGHVTILAPDKQELNYRAHKVKDALKVVSQ